MGIPEIISSKEAAEEAAETFLRGEVEDWSRFAIFREITQERRYGWVVFWNTIKYIETRNRRETVAGNTPILVLRTGALVQLPTGLPLEWSLEPFEKDANTSEEPAE